jgi:bisphosphoglycerate-independent phosphoglycerate mutase (AlkP superfamily)
VRFGDLFFELEDVKSGMHHPDGMLWVRLPGTTPQRHAGKVPLASVAPTLLNLLSLPAPSHMIHAPIPALCAEAAFA